MLGRAGAYGRRHAVAFLALFVALGGTSYAVTQGGVVGSGGQINACVLKGSGVVRLVSPSESCRGSEQPVSWNQTGLPGSPGPVRVTVRVGAPTTIAGGDAAREGTASVNCSEGEKAVGGGGFENPPPNGQNNTVLYSSQAIKDGSPVGTN
jgi:hypothetical protein